MSANAPQPETSTWNIDPAHTTVEFKVRHLMISNVKGQFTSFSGALNLNETDVSHSSVEATIEAASLNTHEADRDTHLKSADFFDVEKYPTLTFLSTNITLTGDAELKVEGDLTIHGVTRKVIFEVEGPTPPAKDPLGNIRIGWSATTKISRRDFGLTWNGLLETGALMIGDEVTIMVEVEAVKT